MAKIILKEKQEKLRKRNLSNRQKVIHLDKKLKSKVRLMRKYKKKKK